MTLSTQDGWAGAVANVGQDLQFHKLIPTVGVANVPHSLWAGGGIPAAGTYGSTGKANGRVLTDASTGAHAYTNAPSGQMYLVRAGMNPLASTCQGSIYLVDRIADCALAHAEATGSITGLTATSRLPAAATNAEACQIFVYVTSALSGASNTITYTYTNQAGTGSRVTQNVVTVASAVANRSCNLNMFVGLQAGDTGVRSIESVTLSSGSATGTLCVCLVRILARIPIPVAGGHVERDLIAELPGPKALYDDTCFDWILAPTDAAVANTPMIGNIMLAYG